MPKTKSIDITFQQGPPISSCNLTICSVGLNYFWGFTFRTLAESFYYVKYGSSIITSKIPSKIISNKNKKTGVSRKIVCFGILIHVLSWRQQKHQCLCFHYWDFLTTFWRNNWQSIIHAVERLCYGVKNMFLRNLLSLERFCVFDREFTRR